MSLYPSFGILMVDDEPGWLRSLSITLESAAGITNTASCTDSREVMGMLESGEYSILLLDLNMPHIKGDVLLRSVKERFPEVTVIVISGMNLIESAVECMKKGASDFFVKTDPAERIVSGVVNAVKIISLESENRAISKKLLERSIASPEAFADIITTDPKMFAVFSYTEAVAKSQHPFLITGESGTGKELLAKAAHILSGRTGNLVTVNVAGLDDAVFADTLFGHCKGAFTGADTVRKGLIEEASNGTLFLDEIGDLSMASQVKLLRLLQEGEYFRLGSDLPRRTNARIIAATHADLQMKEKEGSFRRDLFYRLKTHYVNIPPLREHPCDIALLTEHFLEESAAEMGMGKIVFDADVSAFLSSYTFPGNIRELKAMIYNAVSISGGNAVSAEKFFKAAGLENPSDIKRNCLCENPFRQMQSLPRIDESTELLVDEAMRRAEGNQTVAARLLGISQPALSKRLKNRSDV